MVISKQDRIALVVSVIMILVGLLLMAVAGKGETVIIFSFMFIAPVLVYWCIRFVNNDISFFRIEEDLTDYAKAPKTPIPLSTPRKIIIGILLAIVAILVIGTLLAVFIEINY